MRFVTVLTMPLLASMSLALPAISLKSQSSPPTESSIDSAYYPQSGLCTYILSQTRSLSTAAITSSQLSIFDGAGISVAFESKDCGPDIIAQDLLLFPFVVEQPEEASDEWAVIYSYQHDGTNEIDWISDWETVDGDADKESRTAEGEFNC